MTWQGLQRMRGEKIGPWKIQGKVNWVVYGLKGADPVVLRSEDSSKASMALPRLMAADSPTALIYEPTVVFESHTVNSRAACPMV